MRDSPSLHPGYAFPERRVARDRAYQDERLTASGVDPTVWGDVSEPVLWALEGFRMMTAAGQDIDGYIHVEQLLVQYAPVPVGEPVTIRGATVSLEAASRGRRLLQRFTVFREDGSKAAMVEHVGLLPDPEKVGRAVGHHGPAHGEADEVLAQKTLTPDQVRVFSGDVGNQIHFDPGFAARYGYHAPLAQGLMTMLWMVGRLAGEAGPLARLDVTARFRRPVYWNDPMVLAGRRDRDGRLVRLETRKADGRNTAEMEVRQASAAP